jgi:mannose/cellobiose epimerase-like protein (N-acyl-D-glucosamine 2-epimerase family)
LRRPHRARVIARQAFSFCEAGQLGWHGPWREVTVVDLDGKVEDPRFDLYNQAFALLAYARRPPHLRRSRRLAPSGA